MANSLYACGYRGRIYAGYRGELPPWVSPLTTLGADASEYSPAPGLTLRFLRLETQEHLTNIKPDFMMQVWREHATAAERLVYLDPDIVFKTDWVNIEGWVDHGVALCEDMNSPLNVTHPLRRSWTAYFQPFGIDYQPRDAYYVNGGFVGVHRRDHAFLEKWEEVQVAMKKRIGNPTQIGIADRWDPFHYTDQDALNVTKDLYDNVSLMEKHAMDFGKIGHVMSHAAGKKKPWTKHHLREILVNSTQPANTDKLFWQHVSSPIRVYSPAKISRTRAILKVAAMLGRIVKRS